MFMTSLKRWKGSTFLLVPVIAGLIFMGFPVKPSHAFTPAEKDAIRAAAIAKGLKSLRQAIQADAVAGFGQPLVLNPELKRNVPLPNNLDAFLNKGMRKRAAQLGKALFWEMAIGADGNSCASCHFAAGADSARIKNQLSPDFQRIQNVRVDDIEGFHFAPGDPDFIFQLVADDGNPALPNLGPNYTLAAGDFPFVKDIGDGDNVLPNPGAVNIKPAPPNTNDVASSMGNFLTTFSNVDPQPDVNNVAPFDENPFNPNALGSANIRDNGVPYPDNPDPANNFGDPAKGAGFMVADNTGDQGFFDLPGAPNLTNVRRVEPRNTPSTVNAVFNLHNFWDGRANFQFNGVSPLGETDRNARIFVNEKNKLQTRNISMKFASLASQAVGPPGSPFEMSFTAPGHAARSFPDIGKKMVGRRALATQAVHAQDSLLAELRHSSGTGLTKTYSQFIQEVFKKNLWDSASVVILAGATSTTFGALSTVSSLGAPQVTDANTAKKLVASGAVSAADVFTQMEANFSFFFGVAVMLYEAELVADDSPFDRFMAGDNNALGDEELLGLQVFIGDTGVSDGRCVNCHGGPELTNASVRNSQNGANLIEPMFMGNNEPAFYDNGFYNIGVTPTAEDVGRGGKPDGVTPVASSRQFLFKDQGIMNINFPIIGLPIRNLVKGNCAVPDPLDPTKCLDKQDLLKVEAGFPDILVCIDRAPLDGVCNVNDDIQLLRVAVDGAMKTPGLRGVELTGPYFHNGGSKTLLEVVEFYDRGGNFCKLNFPDLDPDIEFIGLAPEEEVGLVKLMIAMTDDRVRNRMAPFDNPELRVPNGHPGNQNETVADAAFLFKQAEDVPLTFGAVGATGGAPIEAFHVKLGITDDPEGLGGHFVAGEVVSDVNVGEAPKCNRPNPPPPPAP